MFAIHSTVFARCHSSGDPNSAIIRSGEGMPIESKCSMATRSACRASMARAIAVFPEPEAPVRTISRMVTGLCSLQDTFSIILIDHVQGRRMSMDRQMLDLRLYALVDPERANGRALDELARRVVAGGATLVQLRDKHGATRRLVAEARAIKQALAASGVPLLVNDRVDVALAAGADGVHVGQDDMAVADARRLLGERAIIGLSVKTPAQAREAPLDLLDYVAIGGV